MGYPNGVDWVAVERRARGMSNQALDYARRDCAETAKLWDHAPYEHERDVAGRYRDEATVYGRELDKRFKRAARRATK